MPRMKTETFGGGDQSCIGAGAHGITDARTEILDISSDQAYALVRSGDLPAIKVGGRGQWRVETVELEAYIQRMYARTREMVEPEQRS